MANTDFWPGLLKWSLSQTDGLTPSSDLRPLSDEDKAFLTNAFESLIVDEVKRIKIITAILKIPTQNHHKLREYVEKHEEALKALKDLETKTKEEERKAKEAEEAVAAGGAGSGSAPSPSFDFSDGSLSSLLSTVRAKKLKALDELDDLVLTLDNANDLHRVGGFQPLLERLSREEEEREIIVKAAQVVATVTQNNPQAQQWALELGAVKRLVDLLEWTSGSSSSGSSNSSSNSSASNSDSSSSSHGMEDDSIRAQMVLKCLYALSQLVRSTSVPALSSEFISLNGISILLNLFTSSSHPRVLTKSLALLRFYLSPQCPPSSSSSSSSSSNLFLDVSHLFLSHPLAVLKLSQIVPQDDEVNLREETVRVLSRLVTRKEGIEKLKQEEFGLKKKLKEKIQVFKAVSEDEKETWEDELRLWTEVQAACGWS